jgi:hypothetical protein
MYSVCETAIVFLFLASVPLAARLAATYGGNWKAIGRGALFGVSGSLIGAVLSGLATNSLLRSPALAAFLPFALAGVFEEAARVLGLWRGERRLSYHLGHALMFGVGFGGAEMISRAASMALRIMRDTDVPLTMVAAQTMLTEVLLAFAIFAFHICMAAIAFRILSDERLMGRAWVLFPLMAADHVTVNLGAASMFTLYPSDAYALCLWAIAAPLHVALALSAWRRAPETTPRALAAGGS